MALESLTASYSSGDLAKALLDKLTVQSGDVRRSRTEFSIDEIDALEADVVSASRSLNALRNAFAPINGLPREVLAHIFFLLGQDNPVANAFLPDLQVNQAPYAWTAVASVCRYWRETAITFQDLWSIVDSESTLAALASLERSGAHPIYVYLRDAFRDSKLVPSLERGRFMETLAHHSDRFVELHIQPTYRYGPALLRAFRYPAPNLRALSIMLNVKKDEPSELPTIFGGSFAHLQRLTLANFTNWPMGQFGNKLTHLCLFDQPLRGRMDMKTFLEFLGSCKRLQELVLVDAGPALVPEASGTQALVSDLVRLDKLQTLHIGNWPTPQSVAYFLQHLVLPCKTKVHIWADCLFRRDETVQMLLPENLEHLHPFHKLKAVHLSYRPVPKQYPQLVTVQDGVLVFYFYYASSASQETLYSVFNTLDMRHVEEFTVGIECQPEIPDDMWKTIFRTMPRLRTLSILRRPSRPILAGLCPSDSDEPLPCPVLSSLIITDDKAISAIRLFLLAEERAERGMRFESLLIVNRVNMFSYRLEEELQDLHKHIEHVKYVQEDTVDVTQLPVGWPTESFQWIMKMRDSTIRRFS